MTALLERQVEELSARLDQQPCVLRRAKVDEVDRLILLVLWDAWKRHDRVSYNYVARRVPMSTSALFYRLKGVINVKHTTTGKAYHKGGGLVDRGFVTIAHREGGGRLPSLGPGPRLAMLNGTVPYELVDVL